MFEFTEVERNEDFDWVTHEGDDVGWSTSADDVLFAKPNRAALFGDKTLDFVRQFPGRSDSCYGAHRANAARRVYNHWLFASDKRAVHHVD